VKTCGPQAEESGLVLPGRETKLFRFLFALRNFATTHVACQAGNLHGILVRYKTKLVNKPNHKIMTECFRGGIQEWGEKRVQPLGIKASSRKIYAQPILRRLTLQQAKIVLSSRIKNIFSPAPPNRPNVVAITSKSRKHYQKPGYQELTPEQIKLILIGQFNLGDEGAGDLLDQLFPEPHTSTNAREELCD
jgi:hypothetical protein